MDKHFYQRLAVSGVQAIKPYQPGKAVSELERELGIKTIIKLASNENSFGPSPLVLDVIRETLGEISRYPDGNGYVLKTVIAEKYGIGVDQVTLGNGSNDILELIARTFLSAGRKAVYSQHGFAVYPLVVQATGALGVAVRAADGRNGQRYGHDLDNMANHVDEACAVVFIANPNNPTGTYCERGALTRFIESVSKKVIIVVDEAYFEYVEKDDYPDTLKLLDDHPNLVITRTLSKAYGLAGLRVGYAISRPEVADLLNRIRQPFNVNSLALCAAEVALSDQGHIDRSKERNKQGLNQLGIGLVDMGIDYIPSVANFLCIDCKRESMPVYQGLLQRGVIVRPVENYELPMHLRVTVGTAEENEKFLAAFQAVLGS